MHPAATRQALAADPVVTISAMKSDWQRTMG